MYRVVSIFILLLASIVLGLQLQKDPGYVLIAFNHWTIETTLSVSVMILLMCFILLHGLFLCCHWFIHLPNRYARWINKRQTQKAQRKTRQGLIEFSEGYWQKASHHLIQALPNADTPLLNYLTAARAAQEMGDSKLRDHYLREAQQSMPEAKVAVELTQAQLQLANRQWEQALATLKHLQTLAPNHPYVLKLLMHLYQEVRDWRQLIALLPELKRHQVVIGSAYQRLQQQTYLCALTDAMKQPQATIAEELFQSLPKQLKYDPEIIALYSSHLIQQLKPIEAENLLRTRLKKQFSEELITLYGKIPQGIAQLEFAESLLPRQPDSAALLLCLGRLCIQEQLWGKAKAYLEKSLTLHANGQTYLALGQLLVHLNDTEGALKAYQHGLQLEVQHHY